MNDSGLDERLREQYLDPSPSVGVRDDCPSDDTALRLVLGELSHTEARRFADHAGCCSSCASAWRLARAYADEARLAGPTSRRRWAPLAGLAAAAVLAMLMLWLPRAPDQPFDPVVRSPETFTVQSHLEEGAFLPVERFVLSWSPGPPDARYDVRVTDDRLRHVGGAFSLTAPEYRVPGEALARFADGDLILWQVDIVLPDRSRSTSSTFSVRVARP